MFNASWWTASWSKPLSETNIECWEDINNLASSLEDNQPWRDIHVRIDAIPSLYQKPTILVATYIKQLIFLKFRDVVNGGPVASAMFGIKGTTDILPEEYLVVAERLPPNLIIGALDEAITWYLMPYEFAGMATNVQYA